MKMSLLFLALVSSSFADTTAPSKPTGLTVGKGQQVQTSKVVKKSIILHDGTHWTIVPTKAVLFLPQSVQDKVDAKPVGKLLPWSDFLAKNASWIATDEVTFDQAAGNQVLAASEIATWKAQEKLVVAVHQNGPVPVTIGNDLHAITQR